MTLPMQLIDRSLLLLKAPETLFSHKTRKGRRLERMLGLVGHIVIMKLLLSSVYFWSQCWDLKQFRQAGLESVALAGRVLGGLGAGIAVGVAAHGWSTTKPMQILNSIHHADRNGFDLKKLLDLYLWYLVVIDCTFPYIAKLCCSSFFWHVTFNLLQGFLLLRKLLRFDVEGCCGSVRAAWYQGSLCKKKSQRWSGLWSTWKLGSTLHSALPFLEYL